MPQYLLLAEDVPAIVPWSEQLSVYADPATPEVLNSFGAGQTTGTVLKLNRNSRHVENIGRYGGGAPAVARGLELSDGGGLTLGVSKGDAVMGGIVQLVDDDTVALTNGARNYLWFTQAGTLTPTLTTALPSGVDVAAFLGSALTAGGSIDSIDYSGRPELKGGVLWRKTGDLGEPSDTPDPSLRFWAETLGGLYFWGGAAWFQAGEAVISYAVPAVADTQVSLDDLERRFQVHVASIVAQLGIAVPESLSLDHQIGRSNLDL